MRSVLADMALDAEAMTALSFRLARSLRPPGQRPREAAFARLITPAAKYWICKAAPRLLYEAMECLGGNGYVEEPAAPGSIGRRRSTRSGKAPATSSRSISCASRIGSPRSAAAVLEGLMAQIEGASRRS